MLMCNFYAPMLLCTVEFCVGSYNFQDLILGWSSLPPVYVVSPNVLYVSFCRLYHRLPVEHIRDTSSLISHCVSYTLHQIVASYRSLVQCHADMY